MEHDMIPLDVLKAVKTIITHRNCSDGTASAIILQDVFSTASVRFLQYDTEGHQKLQAEPGMLFCDMSPPEDRVDEFVAAGAIVLDHHATVEPLVAKFGKLGVFADLKQEPGVSGAVLAYREVWLPLTHWTTLHKGFAEWFVRLAGIHDTWQTQDPLWRKSCELNEILRFYPNDWWLSRGLGRLADRWETDFSELGKNLLEKHEAKVQRATDGGFRWTSPQGTKVIIFEGVTLASGASEVLGSQVDLVAAFNYFTDNGQPKVIWSLRSHTSFDCGAFAKERGGGGHTKSAGFGAKVQEGDANPYDYFKRVLEYVEMMQEARG